MPTISAASSTEHVRFSVFISTCLGNESSDGLDGRMGWGEGDDVAGFGWDDPSDGVDGDADVAVVVDWDGAAVEDDVAGADRFWSPVDRSSVVGLRR